MENKKIKIDLFEKDQKNKKNRINKKIIHKIRIIYI